MLKETLDLDQIISSSASSENYNSICRRLITKIISISNQSISNSNMDYDRIYVSNSILNLLSDSSAFSAYGQNLDFDESKPLGMIAGRINVYLKEHIAKNQIIFSYQKSQVRDSKIEVLLDQKQTSNLQELILEIKSEFI